MTVSAIRQTLASLRKDLDVIDYKRFKLGLVPNQETCGGEIARVNQIVDDPHSPLRFTEGLMGFLRIRDQVEQLSEVDLALFAEEHLSKAFNFLFFSRNADNFPERSANYRLAIEHSGIATSLLWIALSKEPVLTALADEPTIPLLQDMDRYVIALGEFQIRGDELSRSNFGHAHDEVQSASIPYYRAVEPSAQRCNILYPSDADVTEGELHIDGLKQQDYIETASAYDLRRQAAMYLVLANLKPFVSLPYLQGLPEESVTRGLKVAETFNYGTQFLLYHARDNDMDDIAATN